MNGAVSMQTGRSGVGVFRCSAMKVARVLLSIRGAITSLTSCGTKQPLEFWNISSNNVTAIRDVFDTEDPSRQVSQLYVFALDIRVIGRYRPIIQGAVEYFNGNTI